MKSIRNMFRVYMNEVAGENAGGGGAPVVAPVAPVVASATPAAPTGAPTPESAPAGDPAPATAVPDTGRPGLNLFLNFLATNGITDTHPAYAAADAGDFSLLRAELAAKGVTGVDQMIALGEAESKALEAEAAGREEQVKQIVLSAFDGDEGYQNEVMDWARANAEPDEKDAINAMFAAGGIQAQAAALLLKTLHQQAGNTTPEKSALTTTAKPGASAPSHLSHAEYQAAISAGVRQYGANFVRSAEAAALRARVK